MNCKVQQYKARINGNAQSDDITFPEVVAERVSLRQEAMLLNI